MNGEAPKGYRFHAPWIIPATLAIVATLAVLFTINDPGLTVDEPINTSHGKRTIWALTRNADQFRQPKTIDYLWRGAHEHPPLARFLIGFVHSFQDPNPRDPDVQSPKLGRPASAFAFGIIVFLVSRLAWKLAGAVGGTCAGLCAITMPRLFGHAHLASPEVISAAAILLGVTVAAHSIDAWRRPEWKGWFVWLFPAGICLGIALLTKLTAILLPLAVTITWLVYGRLRAILPLILYGLIGVGVFIWFWPWMWPVDLPDYPTGWLGTYERLREYISVGVDRATVYVGYFGQQYPNKDSRVPWHFVWVYFFLTVPLATHALASWGSMRMFRLARSTPVAGLVLVQLATILVFFTLPIDKYDGERLFLAAFPLVAVVAGVGAGRASEFLSRWLPKSAAVALVLAAASSGIVPIVRLHPFELSYYNMLVGGLAGADRLGLEATYWGDSVSDDLLDEFAARAKPNEWAGLVPTLYSGHAVGMMTQEMREKNLAIIPPEYAGNQHSRWAIVFNRSGYLGDPLPKRVMAEGKVVAEVLREGVWLARLYELPAGFRWKDENNADVKGGS